VSQYLLGHRNGPTGIIAIQRQLGHADCGHRVGLGLPEESLGLLDSALAATQVSEAHHYLVRKGRAGRGQVTDRLRQHLEMLGHAEGLALVTEGSVRRH
jgi:hypothetical protein